MSCHKSTNSATRGFTLTGSEEGPQSFNPEVMFVITKVDEVFVIFVLPCTTLGKLVKLVDVGVCVFNVLCHHRLYFVYKCRVVCIVVGDEAQRIMLQISLIVEDVDDNRMKIAVYLTQMESLDFVLHKKVIVLSITPKD
uniref:Uncharacterized protein n=1 Tax=Lepeophtheirus salmonis TaxID=72036 RepID=A0A0K2USA7_LEPSM